jgi:O-antigen/teichoic acid export membrane protein
MAERNEDGVREAVSVAFLTHCAAGIFAAACAVAIAIGVTPHLHIDPLMLAEARYTILLAGITIAISFPLGVFSASLTGLGRFPAINAISIAFLLLRTVMIVLLLRHGHGLVALAAAQLFCTALSGVVSMFYLFRILPFFRFVWSLANRGLLRQMVSHSVYAFLLSVTNRLNYEVDSLVIVAFLPVANVTFYVLGFRLISYLRDFANTTTLIVMPATSAITGADTATRLERVVTKGSLYVLSFTYPIVIALLFCGGDFLRLWVGPSYAVRATPVLLVFGASQFISLTQYIPAHMLFGLSRHRMNVWCTAGESILNLALSIVFVQKFGITGVALGTAISVSLVRGLIFPACFAKSLHTTVTNFLRMAVAPTIVPTAAMALCLYGLRRLFGVPGDYLHLLLPVVLAAALYAVLAWQFAFDAADRERFSGLLPRRRSALSARAGE